MFVYLAFVYMGLKDLNKYFNCWDFFSQFIALKTKTLLFWIVFGFYVAYQHKGSA